MNTLNTIPPIDVMAAAADRGQTGPDRGAAQDARSAVAAPLLKLVHADPEASKAIAAMRAAVQALEPLPDPVTATLADRRMPAATVNSLFGDVDFRVPPFEYAGHSNSNASMYPDHVTGKLGISGKSGHIEGGLSGQVSGVCWVGTSVYSDGARPIRCSPVINWKAGWHLGVAGLPDGFLFGADPWASARGGVQIQAYDTQGAVSPLEQRELFNVDLRESPGATWVFKDGSNDGTSADMNIWFDLPAGAPRWVNVLSYIDMNAAYTGASNVAAVSAGLDAQVRWIVVDWQP
jgi:hypothetical protein